MEILKQELSLQEKLNILADAAKYDVACTSSGVDRRGQKGSLGNSCAAGICHSFAADGRCISLLKILQSNECVYDCKYCLNRAGNDRPRATFTPEEICRLVMEFYRRNYIEGLFLSSGVCKSPAHTMELMCRTLRLLRTRYRFNGYIHVKAIPNAPAELLEQAGYLADRMSVNLELPTASALRTLAPHKTRASILKPMGQIQQRIADSRLLSGLDARMERSAGNRYLSGTIFDRGPDALPPSFSEASVSSSAAASRQPPSETVSGGSPAQRLPGPPRAQPFAPAGQSTQMIIGASQENDYQLLTVSQYLYQKYDLKRVFYSAYVPLNEEPDLPPLDAPPPLLREHRLYQADWLLRYYGFHADDLLSTERPNFNVFLDPKCDWALRHLECFPVEINRADYASLLKVPGIGPKSAMRIVKSRRLGLLTFESLKKIGVVLKRAKYFITCQGRMLYHIRINEDFITRQLIGEDSRASWELDHPQTYRQLSLFDDVSFAASAGNAGGISG